MPATAEIANDRDLPAVAAFRAAFEETPVAHRFKEEQLETIYGMGYQLYQQAQYLEALSYFRLLTLYRPLSMRYLKALATAQFMARRHPDAAMTCALMQVIDPEDPDALYIGGQALLMNGETEDARRCLEAAAGQKRRNPEIATRARAFLNMLNRERGRAA